MSRATEDALDELHGLLTNAWKARLLEAKQDPERPLTAAEATSLAKFLADNGIKGLSGTPRMQPLKEALDSVADHDTLVNLSRYRT